MEPVSTAITAAASKGGFGSFLKGLGGSLVSGIGSLFGGSSQASEARRLRKQQRDQFNQMMDATIQRRVRDAKLAGIHPLAALGVAGSASPTLTGAGIGAEGRAIEEASEAVGGAIAGKKLMDAQLAQMNSQTRLNEAEAGYWRSEAARRGSGNPGTTGSANDAVAIDEFAGTPQYYVPEVPTSQAPGLRTGAIPENVQVTTRDGGKIEIPNPDLNLDEIGQAAYVRAKVARYIRGLNPESARRIAAFLAGLGKAELKRWYRDFSRKPGRQWRSVPRSEYLLDIKPKGRRQ